MSLFLSRRPLQIVQLMAALFFLLGIGSLRSRAQCNTTLNKVLAERSVNNDDRFGSSLAANDRFMVVGAENSDTLGILYAGAAFVYEKTAAGWAYRAMLTHTDPDEYDFFANELAIDASGNTIVVINRHNINGGVYIFEKPSSGWQTMTETAKVTLPSGLSSAAVVDISDDGATIAVSSPEISDAKFYVLEKPAGGWNNSTSIQTFFGPDYDFNWNFFGMDILLQDDYLYLSSDNDPTGSGIYVYKKIGPAYQQIAKLSYTVPNGQVGWPGRSLTAYGDLIVTTGAVSQSGNQGEKLFVFKKNGEWTNSTEASQVIIPGYTGSSRFPFPIQFVSSTEIAASVLVKDGDYYTGKVLLITANDPSWQNLASEVIYEEGNLNIRSEFSNTMVWTGSELIHSVGLKRIGLTERFAVVSQTRAGSFWGSLQQVTLNRTTSSNVNFGSSVVKADNILFAGAPYDGTAGKDAGAVYLYEKTTGNYIKTHTILPTRRVVRPNGTSDVAFGYSMAVYGNELAVGAPSYRVSKNNLGKIFLYKKVGASWTSATLYDSLVVPDELMLVHVGAKIVMNDHLLFASAYNNYNDEHSNAVVIFEKINSKWNFQQVLKPGRPIARSWPSISLSLHGDELMVGKYFGLGSGISMYAKNPADGNWAFKQSKSAETYSGFGSDVELGDNHLFVGVPAYNFQNVQKSGAVFVYTKLPGEEWDLSAAPSAIIGPTTPLEGGYFGSTIKVIGNTLVVGAPGKFLTEDNNVRTIPGNTYVIQAKDYYWKNTTQYLNLQGDRYAQNERDYFGSAVDFDESNIYIGAQNENTSTGMFSGAVYYVPSPPIVFLHPPICEGSGVVQLQGYPFGGTWSGSGVEDPSGRFNPVLAGNGTTILTYTTPNCSYLGTVQIEVIPMSPVAQLSSPRVSLCENGSATLRLSVVPGKYQWFFKPDGADTFVAAGNDGAVKVVTNPGQYFAEVMGSTCKSLSPVFDVYVEDVRLRTGPQNVICSHNQAVALIGSNNEGIWEGTGVKGKNFESGNLSNGIYQLIYRVTTPGGCSIALRDSIKVNVIERPSIARLAGDFCQAGSALLQAEPGNLSLAYRWYFSKASNSNLLPIERPLTAVAEVFESGYYHVSAENIDGCKTASEIINIGFDNDLHYQLTPGENVKNVVCGDPSLTISISSREGTNYSWEYKEFEGDQYVELAAGSAASQMVRESGYYKVKGEYGFCSFESKPIIVEFIPDSVYVPNVFTPNGDNDNPTFKVMTPFQIVQLKIFNRYGAEIYSASSHEWDGGDAPSGTYYWHIKYEGCETRRELKGWVSLVR